MKKFLVCLVALAAMTFAANAANYSIDDSAIDCAIENALEVSPLDVMAEVGTAAQSSAAKTLKIGSNANPVIAFVLAIIPVTSWIAVHRMYMGTSALAVILNIVTGAGFGIVYVVDWVVLLINGVAGGDISQYCNNPRWWMWANII